MTTLRELALDYPLRRGVHRGVRPIELLLLDVLDPDFDALLYLRVVSKRLDVDGCAARLVLEHLVPDDALPGLDDELLGIAAIVAGAGREEADR